MRHFVMNFGLSDERSPLVTAEPLNHTPQSATTAINPRTSYSKNPGKLWQENTRKGCFAAVTGRIAAELIQPSAMVQHQANQ